VKLKASMAAAICAALALSAVGTPSAGAHDSLAPRGIDRHTWLPHEHWVKKHWVPYDEDRLRELLRVSTRQIFAWLKDDHRTLAQLARRRGVNPRTLGTRLLAPRRAELPPRTYAVLRGRAGLEPDASLDGERRRRFVPARPEAQCRTRTGDPFLTMEVLYQLS
jgi:hypothetical protein